MREVECPKSMSLGNIRPGYLVAYTGSDQACPTEQHGREETIRRYAWIGPLASGRVNQKVEPWPGALSTPTCPWCCSTIALAMANPSPNPLSGPWCPGAAT